MPATLFDLVERAGGRVVLDATEGGRRTMPRPFDAGESRPTLSENWPTPISMAIPDAFRRPNSRLYEWLGRELAAKQRERDSSSGVTCGATSGTPNRSD